LSTIFAMARAAPPVTWARERFDLGWVVFAVATVSETIFIARYRIRLLAHMHRPLLDVGRQRWPRPDTEAISAPQPEGDESGLLCHRSALEYLAARS